MKPELPGSPRAGRTPPASAAPEDDLLRQFDQAWHQGQPPRIEEYLTRLAAIRQSTDSRSCRAFLEELVKSDLEYRWRMPPPLPPLGTASSAIRSVQPRLEDYAARFADLGPLHQLSIDLIAEEYWVRHSFGDRPAQADYQGRFPQQWARLRPRLVQIDAELAAERGPGGPRPSPPSAPVDAEVLRDQLRSLGVVLASASEPSLLLPPGAGVGKSAEPIASVPALLELLRQCELLSAAQINQLQQCPAAQPRELGRELLQRNWLTPYQVNKLLQGRGAELILGPYLLLERLGEGGAGQVFKARHLRMNRLVAIKVLRKEVVTDAEVLARFYREIQLVSQLNHPNIVQAFDAGPIGQSHVLVMEFVEGVDLGRRVRDGGLLPVAEACEYVRQAAVALQHAHEKGLVHRDIKPNNLLLESAKAGRPAVRTIKVLDFGLARLQRTPGNPASLITPLGATTMLGTPDYLAPEQALDFHAADIRADIYSLGCTFYYLLTGRAPFASSTLAETLLKHQQGEPVPVAQFRQDVPPWLLAVLGKMMAKRPPDRYQTPAEVAAALAGAGLAQAVPRGAAANPPPSLNRKHWAWAATALLVLVLATGWIVWPKSSDSRPGAPTGAGESEATILAVNPLPLRGPPVDLAGRKYYIAGGKGVRGNPTASPIRIGDAQYSSVLDRPGLAVGLTFKDGPATMTSGDTVIPVKPGHKWSVPLQGDGKLRTVRVYFGVAQANSRGPMDYRLQAGSSRHPLTVPSGNTILFEATLRFKGTITVEFQPQGELPGAFFALSAVVVE